MLHQATLPVTFKGPVTKGLAVQDTGYTGCPPFVVREGTPWWKAQRLPPLWRGTKQGPVEGAETGQLSRRTHSTTYTSWHMVLQTAARARYEQRVW